eukprot:8544809-Pyramimonas_sp.AAC.1
MPGVSAPLRCCGRGADGPAAEPFGKERIAFSTSSGVGCGAACGLIARSARVRSSCASHN